MPPKPKPTVGRKEAACTITDQNKTWKTLNVKSKYTRKDKSKEKCGEDDIRKRDVKKAAKTEDDELLTMKRVVKSDSSVVIQKRWVTISTNSASSISIKSVADEETKEDRQTKTAI